MQKFCTKCGTPLAAEMRVCPRCGKVASSSDRRRVKQPSRQMRQPYETASPRRVRTEQPQRLERPARPARPARQEVRPARVRPLEQIAQPVKRRRSSEKRNRAARRVFGLLTAAVVIATVYIVIFSVQVFRVKISSYPFETTMKLASSNYGQAIGSYFDEGKWSVNPFSGRCAYKGRSKHGEEYEIVFSAWFSVELEEIVIDGDEVDKKLYEQKVMALFM